MSKRNGFLKVFEELAFRYSKQKALDYLIIADVFVNSQVASGNPVGIYSGGHLDDALAELLRQPDSLPISFSGSPPQDSLAYLLTQYMKRPSITCEHVYDLLTRLRESYNDIDKDCYNLFCTLFRNTIGLFADGTGVMGQR